MAYWMSGNNTPDSAVSINALIGRFGGEVYDVLDITPVVETEDIQALQQLAEILKDVPRERHNDLVFAVRAWAELNGYIISENKKGESSNEE